MRVVRIALVCLLPLVWTAPNAAGDGPTVEPTSFRVVGYLPDYRAAQFDPVAARLLTDLVVFSAEPTSAGELDLSRIKKFPLPKLRSFKTRERVRLILCVGGWGRSTHFAALSASDAKREAFVKSVVRFCLDERFDGVDLDWEHPQNEAEQEGYAKLLTDLRQAFEPHGLVLSVTVAGWQKLPPKAFEAVDWVNIMAYDHGGKHSTFEGAKADVKKLTDTGAPARKITLGLPFYGRDTAKRDRTMTYREILAQHKPEPDADEVGTLYFNGPATVKRKTEYAREAGLAGVMVWELGQDAPGEQSLLKVIRSAVSESSRK